MPGVFQGSTELTDLGDVFGDGVNIQEVYVGATKVFPPAGNGGFGNILQWSPVDGQAIPGGWTFTRATDAMFRNDSGIWQTVGSGVARTAHNALPGGGDKGYLPEPTATKRALFPRDLTNAVWVATDITTAKDAVGIDGVSNAASTLTATGSNGTIFQSLSNPASQSFTFSCFVARKTGTGTIEITVNGGAAYTDITADLTGDIDNLFYVFESGPDPEFGFRMGTSGDEIEVDMADVEQNNQGYFTSPLDHSSSTQTREADLLSSNVTIPQDFSLLTDITGPLEGAFQTATVLGSTSDNTLWITTGTILVQTRILDGSGTLLSQEDPMGGFRRKFSYSRDFDDVHRLVTDKPNTVEAATNNPAGVGEVFRIGSKNTANQFRGTIHSIGVSDFTLTEQEQIDLIAA